MCLLKRLKTIQFSSTLALNSRSFVLKEIPEGHQWQCQFQDQYSSESEEANDQTSERAWNSFWTFRSLHIFLHQRFCFCRFVVSPTRVNIYTQNWWRAWTTDECLQTSQQAAIQTKDKLMNNSKSPPGWKSPSVNSNKYSLHNLCLQWTCSQTI